MILRRLSGLPNYGFRSHFGDFDRMRQEMETLAAGLKSGMLGESRAGVFPLINVTENKNAYVVRAELPGIKADEINISVTRESVALSGERKIPDESRDVKYHRKEREAGNFNRIITLPGQIDTKSVEASSLNGVLKIILPKTEEAKPRQITIKSE